MVDPNASLIDMALFRDICACAVPTPLLKFGRGGKFSKPGFRNFFVSPDLTALCWKSKMRGEKKIEGEKKVLFLDVTRIHFGQRTEKFKKNNRPDLENLSFSLVFYDKGKEDTLDLVCKDELEFQTWNTVLAALHEEKLSPPEMEIIKQKLRVHLDEIEKNGSSKGTAKDDEDDGNPNDVYGFGWGEWGQNGTGDTALSSHKPVLVSALLGKGILAAACGWSHTTVLLETGELQAYGNSVGTAFNLETFLPAPISMTRVKVVSIACGAFHSIALTSEGHCLSWGANSQGQLGHGHIRDLKTPTLIEDLLQTSMGLENNITSVACSQSSTVCVAENGNVYTWGSGEHGVLGQGHLDDSWVPNQVKELIGVDVVLVAAGDSHMFACTETDTYSWGWNACGQLGLGHEEDQSRPHIVEELRNKPVISISAGAAHSIAVINATETSVVYSWGSNSHGQIGQGKTKKLLTPTVVPKVPQMTMVSCGSMHSCLLSDISDLWCCGANNNGQLGCERPSDFMDEFQPCLWFKESGKKVRTVACGGQHTAVLSGRMWIDDKETKECMNCKAIFTFTNRKHHCRNCLGIFCNSCSNKKFAILKYGSSKMVRVCVNCYTKLAGR